MHQFNKTFTQFIRNLNLNLNLRRIKKENTAKTKKLKIINISEISFKID